MNSLPRPARVAASAAGLLAAALTVTACGSSGTGGGTGQTGSIAPPTSTSPTAVTSSSDTSSAPTTTSQSSESSQSSQSSSSAPKGAGGACPASLTTLVADVKTLGQTTAAAASSISLDKLKSIYSKLASDANNLVDEAPAAISTQAKTLANDIPDFQKVLNSSSSAAEARAKLKQDSALQKESLDLFGAVTKIATYAQKNC